MTTVTFLGAARTVTGSKALVETDAARLLVDCGQFQGYKHLRLQNRERFPFDPTSLDAVLLTDAHLDHAGLLPRLVRAGYPGPIHCTSGTRDLCRIVLPESALLHEEDARHAATHGYSRHEHPQPLYHRSDAEAAVERLHAVAFGEPVQVGDLEATFHPTGHLLGAAAVRLQAPDGTLLFSGDVGRDDDALMRPPAPRPTADRVVLEATYGDVRRPPSDPPAVLGDVVRQAADRDGVVLIPCFAVGRTQTVLHLLAVLRREGAIPEVPVYVDSPLATDATGIYCDHLGEHRLEPGQCEAMCGGATYVREESESRDLDHLPGPAIIIAGNGMATGGRILHHLKAYAPDARNAVVFAGHQAAGTRGYVMSHGAVAVKIHGEMVPVRARVEALRGFSGHADQAGLLRWLQAAEVAPREVFLVHGDEGALDALRVHVQDRLRCTVHVPAQGERFPAGGAM